MRIFISAAFVLLGVARAQAPVVQAPAAPVEDRSYQLLRENEDWSFLRDPALRDDFWDAIKYMRLSPVLDHWYFTIGGEVRQVWEQTGNNNWGKSPYMDAFYLARYMLHLDFHFGKHYRTFVQLKSGLEAFRRGGPRPIDEKKLDFEAAYFEANTAGDENWVALRVGRQELNYGSGRLLSIREGPNVRQSFDGLKLRGKLGEWHIDGFAVRPDLDKPGFFNNAPDHQTALWGVYSTRPVAKTVSVDAYYIGIDRKQYAYERGAAQELRHSFGARLWRPIATERAGSDFDYEGVWQAGAFGSTEIRAWTVASDSGYSLPNIPLKPRFSMKADASSGDNPNSRNLGTFSPVYPLGNYFGVIADTGPGPVNFIDVHPRLQTHFGHGVSLSTDLVVQWRENVLDGVYAVPGFLIQAADGNRARFVGYRPGAELRWQIDRHAYLQADYGIFYAGKFLQEATPGRNLNYWELWAGYKF